LGITLTYLKKVKAVVSATSGWVVVAEAVRVKIDRAALEL